MIAAERESVLKYIQQLNRLKSAREMKQYLKMQVGILIEMNLVHLNEFDATYIMEAIGVVVSARLCLMWSNVSIHFYRSRMSDTQLGSCQEMMLNLEMVCSELQRQCVEDSFEVARGVTRLDHYIRDKVSKNATNTRNAHEQLIEGFNEILFQQ